MDVPNGQAIPNFTLMPHSGTEGFDAIVTMRNCIQVHFVGVGPVQGCSRRSWAVDVPDPDCAAAVNTAPVNGVSTGQPSQMWSH
jgi:hypothetical protein